MPTPIIIADLRGLRNVARGTVNFAVAGTAENFNVCRPCRDDVAVEVSPSAFVGVQFLAGFALLATVFIHMMHAEMIRCSAALALTTVVTENGFTQHRSVCAALRGDLLATSDAAYSSDVFAHATAVNAKAIEFPFRSSFALALATVVRAPSTANKAILAETPAIDAETLKFPSRPTQWHTASRSIAFHRWVFIGHA